MGNDLARGLLEFSRGKKLGPRGLYWLKVHLANKLGYDKVSLHDRVQFVNDMMPKIIKTVKDPLAHDWWIEEQEDCWQALSAMFDLVAAIDSGDPENYVR